MKAKLFLLLCISLVSLTSFGQYGTEREKCRIAVIGFPKFAIPLEQRTFFVNMYSSKKVIEMQDLDASSNDISIWGWSRTYDPDQAHLTITIDFGALVTEEIKARRPSAEAKDFIGIMDYTLPIEIQLSSKENKVAFNTQEYDLHGTPIKLQYVCDKKFPTPEKAVSYIKSNKELIDENIIHAEVAKAIKLANDEALKLYAFQKISERVDIYHLDSKKSEFFDQQENDYKDLISFFKLSTTEQPISPAPIKLIINNYKKIIEQLDDADKKQKSAKIDLIITVANLYYVVEEFGECEAWAHKLMEEYNEKEGKNIIEKLNIVRNDIARFGVQSRHFTVQSPKVDSNVPMQNASEASQPAEKVIERVIETEKIVEKRIEVPIVKDIVSVENAGNTYKYKSIKEAFEVAQSLSGEVTIKLLDNALFTGFYSKIDINSGNIKFDLNGKYIFGDAANIFYINDGTLDIKANGGGIIMKGETIFYVNGGTVNIIGGIYMAERTIEAFGNGVVTLSDAEVRGRYSTLHTKQNGKIIIDDNCQFISTYEGTTIDYSDGGSITLKEGIRLDKFVNQKGMVEIPLAPKISDNFGSSKKK